MTSRSGTGDAYHPWATYIHAREEARRRGDRRVGTEHLVLGLLRDPAVEAVLGAGLQPAREALDALDREALEALGIPAAIDAPPLPMRGAPPRPTLKAVLQDRLPLTPAAKLALQEAGRPMRRGVHITPGQVVEELLDLCPPDPGAVLLAALGVDPVVARSRIVAPSTAA
ncbi:MAG: Clp protease N-terminal domain-containing protein [Acidimicrobiales bacterium]